MLGTLGDPDLDRVISRDALGELAAGLTVTRHYGRHGEARARDVSVFIESFAPPPRMIIFGAVDFTAALAKVAKILGYRVTVCDARPVFATRARFPMADEVVVDWPDKYLAEVGRRPRADATRSACSPTTPSSTCRPSWPPWPPRSATSGPWARGGPTTIAPRACARPGVDEAELARVMGPDRPGHRGPHARGDGGGHLRRDHRPAHRPDRPVAARPATARSTGTWPARPSGSRAEPVGSAAAVLAAGGGSRFAAGPDAAHKLLAPWRGRPLVWAAAANAVAAGPGPVPGW